jgi:ankyrin repeat protein
VPTSRRFTRTVGLLSTAARVGLKNCVYRLIGRGADVNAVDKDGRTALHDAARAGLEDIIRELISRGANVKAVDKDGWTALYDAARVGSGCQN